MYLTDLERFTIGWFIQLVYRARVPMWLPSRNASAISVSVGGAWPPVGKMDPPVTNTLSVP